MMLGTARCRLGIYCGGEGKVQVHVVHFNAFVCIKCVAGEESITQKQVREHLSSGVYSNLIHRARAFETHVCP